MEKDLYTKVLDNLSIAILIFDNDDNLVLSNSVADNLFDMKFPAAIIISLSDIYNLFDINKRERTGNSFTFHNNKLTLQIFLNKIFLEDSEQYTMVKIIDKSSEIVIKDNIRQHTFDMILTERARVSSVINAYQIMNSSVADTLDKEVKKEIFVGVGHALFHLARTLDSYKELSLFTREILEESLEFENIKLCDSVKSATDEINSVIKLANKSINIDMRCSLNQLVYVDRYRFNFIIQALLINSVYYSDEAGVNIIIDAIKFDNYLELSIEDNGWGIRQEEQSRIFSYNFRGKNGNKSNYSGAGAELYICRQILTKMGCEISFSSEFGKGCKFVIMLPVPNKNT